MKISISLKLITIGGIFAISINTKLMPYPCAEFIHDFSEKTAIRDELEKSVALERENLQFFSYTKENNELEQFQALYKHIIEILLNNSSPFFDLLTDGFLKVAKEFKKLEEFSFGELNNEAVSQKFFDWLGIMYLFISTNKNNTHLSTVEHEVITLFLKACNIAEDLNFIYIKSHTTSWKPHTKMNKLPLSKIKTRFIETILASGALSSLSGMVGPALSLTAMAGALGLAVHKIESFFKDPYKEKLKNIEAANKRNRQHLKEFARAEKRLIRDEAEQIQSRLDELDKRLKGSERMFEQIRHLSQEIITGKKQTIFGSARLRRLIDRVF